MQGMTILASRAESGNKGACDRLFLTWYHDEAQDHTLEKCKPSMLTSLLGLVALSKSAKHRQSNWQVSSGLAIAASISWKTHQCTQEAFNVISGETFGLKASLQPQSVLDNA